MKYIIYSFLAFWAIVFITSCASDTAAGSASETAHQAADQLSSDVASADPAKDATPEAMMTLARRLAQEHESFGRQFKNLREEFNTVPAEVRRNAVRVDELESRLDGFMEKEAMRVDELNGVVRNLQKIGQNIPENTGLTADADFQSIIAEHKGAIDEMKTEYEAVRKALAELKASIPKKGKGVVLFD